MYPNEVMNTSYAPSSTLTEDDLTLEDALHAWVPIAYQALKDVASTYQATITREQLAARVQDEAEIAATLPQHSWLPKVLELCAAQAAKKGEPPIASLCLRADGTVGAMYPRMPKAAIVTGVEEATGTTLVALDGDVDLYAAEHRLLCYRTFAPGVPDNAVACLPDELAQRRERARNRAEKRKANEKAEAPRPVCMSCFTQLPASGICGNCEF